MSYKQKILRGFVTSLWMAFAISALGYVMRFILAKNLSLKEYGLFYAVFSFVSFFNLFRDFGLNVTAIKFISNYRAKNNRKEIKTTIVTTFLTQLIVILVISFGLILFANYLSENYFKADAFYVIVFMALSYFFSITQDAFSTISSGFQNMFYANISELLRQIIIILIILVGFMYVKTAALVAFAFFVVMLFLPILHITLLLKQFPDFFKIKIGNKVAKLKEMGKYSFPILIASAGGLLIAYSDTILLTYFKTLEEVALYNAAMPASIILWYFGVAMAAILLPVISEMWQKKKKKYVSEGISLLHKYSFALIIPFALLFVAFPEIILRVLLGEKFVSAALALQILSIGAIVYNIAVINAHILVAIGKPKINSKIMIFAAIFNIVFNIILIPKYGMVGSAITTATSYFIIFVLNTINLKKITGAKLPIWQYLKTIFGGLIFLGVVYSLKGIMDANMYLKAAIISVIGFIVYGAYLILTKTISYTEIKDFLEKFKSKN